MERLKILLVDDHSLVRKGISSLMESERDMEVVGEAVDGLDAIDKCRQLNPDIVLMDIRMPRCNGLEATRVIKEEMPGVRIVILTVSDDDEYLFEAVKSGAQGYLLKNLEPAYLFELLRGVARGEAPISPVVAGKILQEFAERKQQPTQRKADFPQPRAHGTSLTRREKEVLKLLVDGATNKEIAEQLFIAENTVKNHLKSILDKLHSKNRVQAAAYALKEGLLDDV